MLRLVMHTITTPHRTAYTIAEFSGLFGRHRSWGFRLAKEGRIKTIKGYGAAMVPAHEIDRILGTSQEPTPGTEPVSARIRRSHVG